MRLDLRALAALLLLVVPAVVRAAPDPLVEKGRYVATAADCAACHTAPNGGAAYAGGYSIGSPLGAIVSSNITPSRRFGIGAWTEAQFADAIRKGVSPEGHLYPAMPYTAYANMSDADMHALWAFFRRGVQPVDVKPEETTRLSFPFNQRWLMIGWNLLFARGTAASAADSAPGAAGRGKYLVQALAHCQTCHTPRNMLMGERNSVYLAGGDVGGWHAPNITSDPVSGIGGWSRDELIAYLRDGAVHGKAQAGGPMAEAVSYSLRHLSEQDLGAIADYLRTVPPVRDPKQLRPAYAAGVARPVTLGQFDYPVDRAPSALADGSSTDGERLYVSACGSCHQLDGRGTADQFYPSLTHNSAVGGPAPANLVMAILGGIHRETNHGVVAMPAFGDELDDAQVAAIANYVFKRFGNAAAAVTPDQVATYRAGGAKPFIQKAIPFVMAAVAILLVALAILAARALSRKAADAA